MVDLKQQYLDELKRLSNLEYRDEIKIAELIENFNDEVIKSSVEDIIQSQVSPRVFPTIGASPPDSKVVSSEVMEIVISKVGRIDADILLTIQDDILRESYFFLEVDAFLAVEDEPTSSQFPKLYLDPEGDMLLLEAFLNDDHSSDFKTKSSSTSLNSLLEETNNFDNSLPDFTTFPKVLFDAKYESDSSDDQSCSDEDVLEKIVLKPLSEEEIIPMKLDQHPDNAESDLMESLRTHDSSLLISSKIDSLLKEFAGELTLLKSILSGIDETDCDFEEDICLIEKLLYDKHNLKEIGIDSLLEEFAGELTLLKSILSGIDKTDCDFEEDICLIEKLLYDNSSPRLSKEFVSANSDAERESFSPSPILVKDSDSLMEKIDLLCTTNYPMLPGIVDEDYDSERDILILKDFPSNNTLSFAEKESFHFDIPPFSRPPTKPPNGDT
nr:hypothetical protein [Tanacetum cinerariifolium]